MMRRLLRLVPVLLLATASCTGNAPPPPPPAPPPAPPPPPPAPPPGTIDPALLGAYAPLPAEAVSDNNPGSPEKVELGHRLFFEPGLSSSGKESCNTCHVLEMYGVDGLPRSKGQNGKPLQRNTPTVFNAALSAKFSWDARYDSLEDFLKAHLADPAVMGATDAKAAAVAKAGMQKYFAAAAPASKSPASVETAALSLAIYLRLLLTPSPWDKFLKGDQTALTLDQKNGFKVFASNGCMTCHSGVNVGGILVQKLGLIKPWPPLKTGDLGKFDFTHEEGDKMMFRSASLRNVEKTGPWSVDGSVTSLQEMAKLMASHQLARDLTDADTASIAAFLSALTGEPPQQLITKPAP
jgi:cytochrome c peroxidase